MIAFGDSACRSSNGKRPDHDSMVALGAPGPAKERKSEEEATAAPMNSVNSFRSTKAVVEDDVALEFVFPGDGLEAEAVGFASRSQLVGVRRAQHDIRRRQETPPLHLGAHSAHVRSSCSA